MNFGLDYLSAHLDSKGYNFVQFENEAKSPVFNQETGDIYNSKIPRTNYRADVHYNDVVIGAHSGGQYNFAEIVSREGLKVTRVDLKVDCTGKELFSEECSHIEAFHILKRKITNFFLKEGRRVQSNDYGVISSDKNSPRGCTFGARGSEYQIRIYTKLVSEKPVVRIEFQLRKELARNVWQEIQADLYNQDTLARAFFSVENTILCAGLLGLDYKAKLSVLRKPEEQEASNREAWVRTQVLSACLKEFKETGKNLPELLLADFNKHFLTLAANEKDYNQISERVANAERLFSE
jgi:hypothetical protein